MYLLQILSLWYLAIPLCKIEPGISSMMCFINGYLLLLLRVSDLYTYEGLSPQRLYELFTFFDFRIIVV